MKLSELTNNPKYLAFAKYFVEFAEAYHEEHKVWIEAKINLNNAITGKDNTREVITIRINEIEKLLP